MSVERRAWPTDPRYSVGADGYMLVNVPDRDTLDRLLADYPLRSTITVEIRPLTSLRAGFTKLLGKVDKRDQGGATP